MEKSILLIIDHRIYNVAKLKHLGEGIRDVYLADFHRQDVTQQFQQFHQTDVPFESIIESQSFPSSDVQYLGFSYFQKNIPKYYHIVSDISKLSSLEIKNKSYFLFPDITTKDKDNIKYLNLFVKDANGFVSVHNLMLETTGWKLQKCYLELCVDYTEKGEVITKKIEANTIEDFVKQHFKGYTPYV